jgi:hypothetical protein
MLGCRQDFDTVHLLAGPKIHSNVLCKPNCGHLLDCVLEIDVSGIKLGVVADPHLLPSEIEDIHRHYDKFALFLNHDRHNLFGLIVSPFPLTSESKVLPESAAALLGRCWFTFSYSRSDLIKSCTTQ